MPMLEALVESSTRLSFHVFAARRVARVTTRRSSCDHIRAHMPNAWQRGLAVSTCPHSRTALLSALIRIWGLALSLHCHCRARRQPLRPRRTPQPTSSERTAERAEPRAAHFRFCGLWLPLTHLSDLWIGEQL